MACGAPTDFANAASNSLTRGPEASHPESSTAATAAFSSSPMVGREKGRKVETDRCRGFGHWVPSAGVAGVAGGRFETIM